MCLICVRWGIASFPGHCTTSKLLIWPRRAQTPSGTATGSGWADEETIFDHYDEGRLTELVETHGRINAALNKAGRKNLHSACLLIDDLADNPEFHNYRAPPAGRCWCMWPSSRA